jgi:hypothetical protein
MGEKVNKILNANTFLAKPLRRAKINMTKVNTLMTKRPEKCNTSQTIVLVSMFHKTMTAAVVDTLGELYSWVVDI